MPKNDPFTKLHQSKFPHLFQQAEDAIKETEITRNTLTIPSINELRYAGYHIANYIEDPAREGEIPLAEGHCKRAIYDAYEASLLYLTAEFKTFKDDYRNVIITDIVPEYSSYLETVNNTKRFLTSIDKETKVQHYQKCSFFYQDFSEIMLRLDNAREELNKKVKKERRNSILFVFAFITIFLGFVTFIKG